MDLLLNGPRVEPPDEFINESCDGGRRDTKMARSTCIHQYGLASSRPTGPVAGMSTWGRHHDCGAFTSHPYPRWRSKVHTQPRGRACGAGLVVGTRLACLADRPLVAVALRTKAWCGAGRGQLPVAPCLAAAASSANGGPMETGRIAPPWPPTTKSYSNNARQQCQQPCLRAPHQLALAKQPSALLAAWRIAGTKTTLLPGGSATHCWQNSDRRVAAWRHHNSQSTAHTRRWLRAATPDNEQQRAGKFPFQHQWSSLGRSGNKQGCGARQRRCKRVWGG